MTPEFNAEKPFDFSQPVFEPTRIPFTSPLQPWEPTDDEETQ